MQIHTPGGNVADGEFPVSFRQASSPFAVITLDPQTKTRLFMETRADCERLIRAAGSALAALDGGTGEQVPAGTCQHHEAGPLTGMEGHEVAERYLDGRGRHNLERLLLHISGYCPEAFLAAVSAIDTAAAADQDARVWAVFEATSTRPHEDVEVAGPFTHREAARWAEVNAISFAGKLTVGRARTDLPAAERPDNGPQRADAIGDHDCGAKGAEDYICTAAQGHTGPHMAYDGRVRDGAPPPSLCHSWPQVSAGDDAGRAIVADLDEQHAKTALTSPVPTRAEQVLPGGYSLPASEAGPGEQLAPVAPDDASMCEAPNGIHTCTRYRGHEGDHAAHGADDVKPVHTWPQHAGTDAQ